MHVGETVKRSEKKSDHSDHVSEERRKGETMSSLELPLQHFPVPLEVFMVLDSSGSKMG